MHMRLGLVSVVVCWLVLGFVTYSAASLECYTCTDANLISDCTSVTTCANGEICFSEYRITQSGKLYSMGCKADTLCPAHNTTVSMPSPIRSIVGRFLIATVVPSSSGTCRQCCHTSNCNRHLCQDSDPSCNDNSQFNCATVGSLVNICADTNHAKNVCKKFCGLCHIVDGSWALWSQWSSCDVTCGNGTQMRTRLCTDPSPAYGGAECVGERHDDKGCSLNTCPAAGSWSTWSGWGACSVTCDVGMKRRDRSCSDPYPEPFGDPCFGDSRDDQLCFPGACADGGWSSWEAWSDCSKLCGGGFKTRSKTCDNPPPSLAGQNCQGDSNEVVACNSQTCPVKMSAFTATRPTSGQLIQDNFTVAGFSIVHYNFHYPLVFTEVSMDLNNDYNTSTGTFTCRYAGLYLFTISLAKERNSTLTNKTITCYINKNNTKLTELYIGQGQTEVNKVATVHLQTGDVVGVGKCKYSSYFQNSFQFIVDYTSTFSGLLVHNDN